MRNGAAGGLVAVDQDETGGWIQGVDGELHRQHGRLEDIKGIDHLLLNDAEAHGRRFGPDRGIELLAPSRAEKFGVAHPLNRTGRGQDHCGCDDRPGQRPAPNLINPRDKPMSVSAKAGFHLSRRRRGDLRYVSLRSEIRAALPLSFRR